MTEPAIPVAARWPVHTSRLILRLGTADDARATWRYRRLPSVADWLTELSTDLAVYEKRFGETARLAATVIIERDGTLIGDFMLRLEDGWAQAEVAEAARNAQAELGWVLDPRFTGQGYATEAVRELLRICFEELGVRRVVANCFLDNDTSWRLMERVGMRREAHAVAESLHRSGRWLDTVAYGMLADEWNAGTPGAEVRPP
jgi:RimJ/RimL family protein N-acetyltransferase